MPASPLHSAPFLRSNPSVTIRIEAGVSSRETAYRLAEFEIDAGLISLDDETPPGPRCLEHYRERYVLLVQSTHDLAGEKEVRWSDAAKLPLCALTPAMRIIDAKMAADGARFTPVVETDTVDALFSHLGSSQLATVASHKWLHALGIPD